MAYTTLVAGTTITAAWANASVRDQTVPPFANAAARSSAITAPVEGMVSHLNDTNCLGVYSGAAWSTIGPVSGPLTTWTPTVTQLGSVTVTNTYSRYQRTGRKVECWFNLSVTGSGTAANVVVVGGLPFTAAQAVLICGAGLISDTSASNNHPGLCLLESTTTLTYVATFQATTVTQRLGTIDFSAALASGDIVSGHFAYEAAADA